MSGACSKVSFVLDYSGKLWECIVFQEWPQMVLQADILDLFLFKFRCFC